MSNKDAYKVGVELKKGRQIEDCSNLKGAWAQGSQSRAYVNSGQRVMLPVTWASTSASTEPSAHQTLDMIV